MAELNKVVAALLRDISTARNISDFYSKEMAKVYSEDAVLKFFPVPRIDIKELNLDLKFAIANVEVDPNKSLLKESKNNSLFDKYSGRFVEEMHAVLKKTASENGIFKDAFLQLSSDSKSSTIKSEFKKRFSDYYSKPASARVTMQTLSEHFNEAFFNQIESPYRYRGFDVFRIGDEKSGFAMQLNDSDGNLVFSSNQVFKTKEEVYDVINYLTLKNKTHVEEKTSNDRTFITIKNDEGKVILNDAVVSLSFSEAQMKLHGLSKSDSKAFSLVKVFTTSKQTPKSILEDKFPIDNPVHHAIDDLLNRFLKEMNDEKEVIDQTESELKVTLRLTADELKGIPETALSSLKITTTMQNYSVSSDPETNTDTLIQQ